MTTTPDFSTKHDEPQYCDKCGDDVNSQGDTE